MKISQTKRFRWNPCPAETPGDFDLVMMLKGFMAKRKHSSKGSGGGAFRGPERGRPPGRPMGRAKPRKGTLKAGIDWIYGVHAVAAAVANPLRRRHRLVAARRFDADLKARLAGAEGGPALESLDRQALEALLPQGAVHQGIALLADPLPPVDLADMCRDSAEKAIVVVLDQATDPHNVGAVLRSAAAFGARGVVVQNRHAPLATGALAKAASGALESVPLIRVSNIARAMEALKDGGFWCLGLDQTADHPLGEVDPPGRVALVLGSEGGGLRRLVRETCDLSARISMAGGAESLNLSNAAAIALYEVSRRR